MGHVLLTGATGLLGRYVMRNLLLAGTPMAVLVRPSRRNSPEVRVEAAMRSWEEQLGRALPRPVVLSGNITEPDFGMSADQIKWAAENCDALLHNAASLSFVSTGPKSEPWRSNVEGTRHVLNFCAEAGIERLFHVSTAYVCGRRHGKVLESELDVGQEFGNPYEESKLQAEQMVRSAEHIKSLTVFRPGIIVGDSVTGMTTTFHNFYAMLQLSYTLNRQRGDADFSGVVPASTVQFNVDGTERKNLVPVDWVGEAMSQIVLNPELHQETYHLTPRVPVTTRLMRDVLEDVVGFYGVDFYGAGQRQSTTDEAVDLFYEHMQVYNSYWRDDPEFDTTNTQRALPHLPCPHVDHQLLSHLSRAAIDRRFSWRDPAVEKAAPVAT
ncbi:MAG: SDR family oxidoreductase [Maioricimonas sp. JB049]